MALTQGAAPGSNPFPLSIARVAGGVEAPPSEARPAAGMSFDFGLRSEPAPDLIRGRTELK
jgi:hypothetical protein